MLDAMSASVVENSACRSRWMIWVESFAGCSPSFSQTWRSIRGSRCAWVPTAPLSLPTPTRSECLREPFFGAAEFVEHERELQPESDRLGVDAVAPANHRRHFVTPRLVGHDAPQFADVFQQDLACRDELHRQRRVENIRRRQTLMDPPRGRADRRRHIFKEGDDVVVGAFLDLVDLRNGEARALANLRGVRRRDLPDFRHRFAGKGFDLEPDLEFSLLGPELAHRRAGISLNHRVNIESRATAAKRFRTKRNVARADQPPERRFTSD